jgi:hypothetical protein
MGSVTLVTEEEREPGRVVATLLGVFAALLFLALGAFAIYIGFKRLF